MRDESIKIPILFAVLLVMATVFSVTGKPASQFIEGQSASNTVPFMESVTSGEESIATSSIEIEESFIATSTEVLTEGEVDIVYASTTQNVASSTEENVEKNQDDQLISNEILYEPEPIEIPQMMQDFVYEITYVDYLIDRLVPDTSLNENPAECQTDDLHKKYKNPGECIREWRASQIR